LEHSNSAELNPSAPHSDEVNVDVDVDVDVEAESLDSADAAEEDRSGKNTEPNCGEKKK
jgi:hypothetical protein